MEEIETRIPSARRALFTRYHVGGCTSCAYQPSDTLTKMCADHNILDVNEVVEYLGRAGEVDAKMSVTPTQLKGWLDAGETLRFIDVRGGDEIAKVAIPGAEPMDYTNSQQYMDLPKDTRIVFACKDGAKALDVAAYFAGHKFEQIYAMKGGLDAWRTDLDPSLADYSTE